MTVRDLAAEVAAYLEAHGPARSGMVAAGIRARRIHVIQTLHAGPFEKTSRPEGGDPRATYWRNATIRSRAVPRAQRRINRADRMLAVLRDGRKHSREEILALAGGPFFLTNNAASDLRKKGHNVRYAVEGGLHVYWLQREEAA